MPKHCCLATCFALTASAADLTLALAADASVSRKSVSYQCDANAVKLGLLSEAFPVEYVNGGGNSLVVVPIAGEPLIFVTVLASSGARYAAQQYVWWEAHGTVTVSPTPGGTPASCHPAL